MNSRNIISWIIFLCAVILTWYNEKVNVDYISAINEVEELIEQKSNAIYASQEFVFAENQLEDQLTNKPFNILRLKRSYFLLENDHEWRELDNDSVIVPTFFSSNAVSPSFSISPDIVDRASSFLPIKLDTIEFSNVASIKYHGTTFLFQEEKSNALFFSANDGSEEQIKVTYRGILPGEYTMLGQISNGELIPYTSKNGKDLSYMEKGEVSNDHIVSSLISNNKARSWSFRILTLILLLVALRIIYPDLRSLVKRFQKVQNILYEYEAYGPYVLSFLFWGMIICISWAFHRPLFLLIYSCVIILGFVFIRAKSK